MRTEILDVYIHGENSTFNTILGGVLVFVLGQIIQNFILKPLSDFNKKLIDISHRVKFHTNVYVNEIKNQDVINRASGDARDMACNLESYYLAIPFRKFFIFFNLIPKEKNINDSAGILIGLSNNVVNINQRTQEINYKNIEKLKKLLNIHLEEN